MAVTPIASTDEERAAVEPFARRLVDFVHGIDPDATFSLGPPIDPGIWLIYLYVRPELVEDFDLRDAIADREVDILVEHDVGLATLLRPRRPEDEPEHETEAEAGGRSQV